MGIPFAEGKAALEFQRYLLQPHPAPARGQSIGAFGHYLLLIMEILYTPIRDNEGISKAWVR